jgi:hypothetical protein
VSSPQIDLSFSHRWRAEILPVRPAILPARHFTYPTNAEEVERGALEVLVHPEPKAQGAPGPGSETWKCTSVHWTSRQPLPFLATCALGFRDSIVQNGIWSTPRPEEICAVSGGYAYVIDTTEPERFTMLTYRPVLHVRPLFEHNLLIFVGHRSILAWGVNGEAWQSPKLSDEGVTITSIESGVLHGLGWNLITDKETPFALDSRTGSLISSMR